MLQCGATRARSACAAVIGLGRGWFARLRALVRPSSSASSFGLRMGSCALLVCCASSCTQDSVRVRLAIATEQEGLATRALAERLFTRGIARWQAVSTRGGARGAFERGEADLYVGSAAELLRSARHGARTPRVLAAWSLDAAPRLLAREPIGALVELKGRAVALDPDEDGLDVLARALALVDLEVADVRLVWCDGALLADVLCAGEVEAIVWAGSSAPAIACARDLTPRVLDARCYDFLIGSSELEQRAARPLRELLRALSREPLAAREQVALQQAVIGLERELVAAGELVGPTGGADAFVRADAVLRGPLPRATTDGGAVALDAAQGGAARDGVDGGAESAAGDDVDRGVDAITRVAAPDAHAAPAAQRAAPALDAKPAR